MNWIKNNRHCLWLLYYAFYFPAFFLLERYTQVKYMIDFPPDRMIPFCEWFIFPYIAWYITMPAALIIFMLRDREAFLKLCFMMFGGMTIALLVYLIAPNGISLRVPVEGNNIACVLCRLLQSVDTPTNVCPSIHVSSSVAIDFAVRRSCLFKDNKAVKAGSVIICALICVSTLFVKQHSIIDVIAGAALSIALYIAAYHTPLKRIFVKRETIKTEEIKAERLVK